jgi:glucosamine 6-phosphate synthetase-like amidotransferase/phosphosugar isomerase protein
MESWVISQRGIITSMVDSLDNVSRVVKRILDSSEINYSKKQKQTMLEYMQQNLEEQLIVIKHEITISYKE